MAGMYPDNQTLELFGKTVSFPGVDDKGRFTNGSFSDPAVRPSFIPAETINLILDNLEELITSLGKTPDNEKKNQLAVAIKAALDLKANIADPSFTGIPTAPDIESIPNILEDWGNQLVTMNTLRQAMRSKMYPIGKIYTQLPSEPTPAAAGLLGEWAPWNARPELYGLSPIPSNQSMISYTNYSPTYTAAAAANTYWLVTHADGDKEIYQLITAKAAEEEFGAFVPIASKWRKLIDVSTANYRPVFVARQKIDNHTWEADLSIGERVTYNGTSYLVTAIHNLGGKFLSGTGGNRPPFEKGGVQLGRLPNITGQIDNAVGYNGTGVFAKQSNNFNLAGGATWNLDRSSIYFDVSRVTLIGQDLSPANLSVNYWRLINLQ